MLNNIFSSKTMTFNQYYIFQAKMPVFFFKKCTINAVANTRKYARHTKKSLSVTSSILDYYSGIALCTV